MGQKTAQEIIEETKDYYCYGLDYPDLEVRIEAARKLPPESRIVDFGTGQTRFAICMALANPYVKVFTFDKGRHDMGNNDFIKQTLDRIQKHGLTSQVFFSLADSREAIPGWKWPVDLLTIDSAGSYEVTKGEIERWYPLVKRNGLIFMQSYGYGGIHEPTEKYPGLRQAVDEWIIAHPEYHLLEKKYGNTRVIQKT